MIKKFILPIILFLAYSASAQLNNNWINYSNTYYKFKLTTNSICRIPQSTIAAAGLQATNADNFQLWRNGQQVRLFTSVTNAPLAATDFIEFFGEMNDGKPDKTLYQEPKFQLADKFSLETDTAAYFLTVNNIISANLRYVNNTNPTPGANVPDAFFMRNVDVYYRNVLNRGYHLDLGEDVFSSSYDNGEGFTSGDINVGVFTENLNELNVFAAGPANSLSFRAKTFANTSNNTRTTSFNIFENEVFSKTTSSTVETIVDLKNLSLSLLQNTTNVPISVKNTSASSNRIVVATLGITYPATFNFNNQKSFSFSLAASASGHNIIIDNFNYGSVAPILYDINNGKRYIGDITSTAGKVQFVLPSSSEPVTNYLLNNIENSNIVAINAMVPKTFVDYNAAANRGDYIIISNPILNNDGAGNNFVEQYRAYRSTANGGGFNAKTVDINELTDQFGFGIRKHPTAIRDFVRFMDANYTVKPKAIFIIGRGVTFLDKNNLDGNVIAEKLDLVPTFGWPASDILLVSQPGTVVPITPVGRLAAVNGAEVGIYFQKVQEYEANQRFQSPLIADKAWMKTGFQIVGGKTESESSSFNQYMDEYENILEDTAYGGYFERFSKTSVAAVQAASSERINQLFAEGMGYLTYFGHSSASTLEFNLSDPSIYNNTGKYPFFNISGCSAGNFYNYNPNRLTNDLTISDKYVFAKQKGSIGFLADTHFGIPFALNNFNVRLSQNIAFLNYGNNIGVQIQETTEKLGGNNKSLDFYTRIHLEQINLHGDPAIKITNFPKPDYVIENQSIVISPSIISVADPFFTVKVKMQNIGKAIRDSIKVSVKRLLPNTTLPVLILDTTILAIKNTDSLSLRIPVNPATDKGVNNIIVELDNTNRVNEIYETNNRVSKEFTIFEDALRPVYPYNYSIITKQNIKFIASTANALVSLRNYVMEIDTTANFNSSFKKTATINSIGGALEFSPTNLTFVDNTVYYWRTAFVPTNGVFVWNNASFIYLQDSSKSGMNQSHFYQFQNSEYDKITQSQGKAFAFQKFNSNVKIKNGVFPTAANAAPNFQVDVDGAAAIQSVCAVGKIIINALNPADMDAMFNAQPNAPSKFSSEPVCGPTRRFNFQYSMFGKQSRDLAAAFLDSIPNGYYVVVRTTSSNDSASNTYAKEWKTDGSNSMYAKLLNAGFVDIDSFNRPRVFNFIYKKGDTTTFKPLYKFSEGIFDKIELDAICPAIRGNGTIVSPNFGPAKEWKFFNFKGSSTEAVSKDTIKFDLIGVTKDGVEFKLQTIDSSAKKIDISYVNAKQYPFIKVKFYTKDAIAYTPYQLDFLRLEYKPLPEAAVAPNIKFTFKDSVAVGEPINFSLAFKNISPTAFDTTMKISFKIKTNNNFDSIINVPRGKILQSGDTIITSYTIPTNNYKGNNTLTLSYNPDNDQPEETTFNNILVKNFYVESDVVNPLLDVTFDGIHILNSDIVSSKPNILIKLKDDSKFLGLTDTSLLKVQLKYPDQNIRSFYFRNADTLRFTGANVGSGDNTANIDFKPYLPEDGTYELIVNGKDVTGNKAGQIEYRSTFTVINKAMISELLNYPNPFTTSTAFVFTLTGQQVPQNMRIQILTITGKVVKEITKDELGVIKIGRNITDYKWDGTDMFGQKLANGVYIYRVITNLNGKSLEKYKADNDDTGKYFNKGYGKMYLMR